MPSRKAATARQVWWASVPVWFVSPEELCEYTQLSPDRIDNLRDLMIFT